MANKKKLFQLFLFSFALLIIFLTYFSNFQKKQTITETKKDETINQEFLVEDVNRFENVEYQGIDKTGNQFTIGSNFAEFEKERPEIIKMEIVKCIFTFKDNTTLTVTSDKGTYNNVTNDMNFMENVRMDYLENVLYSDRASFNNYENQLLVAGNIKGEGPTTDLQADELDFDLNTKDLKMSMYSKERVKVNTKF